MALLYLFLATAYENDASSSASVPETIRKLLVAIQQRLSPQTLEGYSSKGVAYNPSLLKVVLAAPLEPLYARDRMRPSMNAVVFGLPKSCVTAASITVTVSA